MTGDTDMLEALRAWERGPILSTATPPTGAIHRMLLFDTPTGAYVLRPYRHADGRRVENEHAIIAHALRHGIPAVAPLPLPLPDGATILTRDRRFYAVFPHAPGRQLEAVPYLLINATTLRTISSTVTGIRRPARYAMRCESAVNSLSGRTLLS